MKVYIETISVPYAGNGFEEQIKHFCICVSEGMTESDVVTPEQTLFITEQMDKIRKMTAIIYLQDINQCIFIKTVDIDYKILYYNYKVVSEIQRIFDTTIFH